MRRRLRMARRRVRTALRPYVPRRLAYRLGLRGEALWWRHYLERGGGEWRDDLLARLDPSTALAEPLITERLARLDRERVRILDVGAGPVTPLGKTYPGIELDITAVDPLGDRYAALLADAGLQAPVPTLACAGEEVAERFGPAAFDIAYSRNALDHSADPMTVIRAMLETVVPGGFVALRHYRCEGANTGYIDLHNWNFDLGGDGSPTVWGPYGRHDLAEELAGQAEVSGWLEDNAEGAPWVCMILEKPAAAPER